MSKPRSVTIPDGVRARELTTSRGRFACVEAAPTVGLPAERPPVLLLPGWTGSKEDYLAVLAPLATDGRRVVAVDQRGQYESPGPDDLAAYTLEALGADAVAFADALDAGPVHLVGHSFGGLVARAAALTDPTAFASLTLLCSGPGHIAGPRHAQLRLMAAAIPVVGLASVYAAKRQFERATGTLSPVTEEIEIFLRRRFCANVPASLVAMTRHLADAPDLVAELASLSLSTLVVSGAEDDGWPLAEQEEMADRLGARHVVIAGAGHSPSVEAPEALVEVLTRFWDEIDGADRQHVPAAIRT